MKKTVQVRLEYMHTDKMKVVLQMAYEVRWLTGHAPGVPGLGER